MRGIQRACLIKGAHHLLDCGAIPYLKHLDCSSERQCWQQLGCQQEALRGAWPTGTLYKLHENLALVDWVHALVNLVYHPERTDCHILHAHENLSLSKNLIKHVSQNRRLQKAAPRQGSWRLTWIEMRYRMVETDRSPPDCLLAVRTCRSSSSLNLTLSHTRKATLVKALALPFGCCNSNNKPADANYAEDWKHRFRNMHGKCK